MKMAVKVFRANLVHVRAMHALHLHFEGLVAPIIDLSDLLRAEMVLIVSALDHFVHEITRVGMMEVWRGMRIATPAYLKFSVSLNVTTLLIGQVGADVHLETEIRTRHGYSSFQQPEDIADAIRLFSTVEVWKEVGALLGEDPKT